jgi:N-acetylglucosamine kinase-like BadF-type ATPase
MEAFLGIDGGGSKTEFVLVSADGNILARHEEGSAYYPEIGIEALERLIVRGVGSVLRAAGRDRSSVTFAFAGLPAYGEDSQLLARLDAIAGTVLDRTRYRCGNDMICGWAGALAGTDGVNVVAGTGSIVYGEFEDRSARAGGWGEIFGDEGSAYWVAREGLSLFSRMSDGRSPRAALYELVRQHFCIEDDLDLCARIYGSEGAWRSRVAALARIVGAAAIEGDDGARAIFRRGAEELAATVRAVLDSLQVPAGTRVPVSHSGGMFRDPQLLLERLRECLERDEPRARLVAPRLPPGIGAALYAARCSGNPLAAGAIAQLEAGAAQ